MIAVVEVHFVEPLPVFAAPPVPHQPPHRSFKPLSGVWRLGHADCTGEAKELCNKQGVQGFPTLKYGDPNNLEDYEGGRDLEELTKFAEENLKPMCSPKDLDLCEEDDRKEIEGFMALSAEDLAAKIAEKEETIKNAGETFDEKLKELQATYEELQKTRDDTIAEVKASGLGLMKSVAAHSAEKTDL